MMSIEPNWTSKKVFRLPSHPTRSEVNFSAIELKELLNNFQVHSDMDVTLEDFAASLTIAQILDLVRRNSTFEDVCTKFRLGVNRPYKPELRVPSTPSAIPRAKPKRHLASILQNEATLAEAQLDSMKGRKFDKVYSKPWKLALSSEIEVWVDRLDIQRSYLGMITGVPELKTTEREIVAARAFAANFFHGPKPIFLEPEYLDPSSQTPILPPLRFAAQLSSAVRLNDTDSGSWMNLVWFAEIDNEKSIGQFVSEALCQVKWRRDASSYYT